MFYTYVIKSGVDGRLYKGHCEFLEKRIEEHNSGKTKSTKAYVPWKLVYFESFSTRNEAVLREKYFKSGIGREFIKEKIRLRSSTG
ncbi:GIY-YIG nuclease family protein [Moheibacter sp.]|uniref:GIY-YIG nuclease family protein n=1 Tax=Moheibacter sp. TaxID=1965316 RepID=UPI003C7685B5